MDFYFVNDLHLDEWIGPKGGYTNTSSFKRFIDDHCLPADCLCVAGDIAKDVNCTFNFLLAASKMYSKVLWVSGYDEACNDIAKVEKFCKSSCKANIVKRLDGTSEFVSSLKISGAMGMCDWTYCTKNFDSDMNEFVSFWNENNKMKTWTDDPIKFSEFEKQKLVDCCEGSDIIMSHYAPSRLVKMEPDKLVGLNVYDSNKVFRRIKDGAYFHFGHVHQRTKKDIKNSNGSFTVINNSVGFPNELPALKNKSDYLISL